MQSAKQLARVGVFYLEEAVLDVLFEAMAAQEDPFVRAVDISRKIGVKYWDNENWIVAGILIKLKAEERVEQRKVRGPWKLTETEYQKRC